MTEPTRGAPPARRFHPASLVVLTVVWVLLWDQISLFLVLTGLLLALLVGLVFPLPPIDLHGRFRPLQGLRLVGRLLVDACAGQRGGRPAGLPLRRGTPQLDHPGAAAQPV